MSSIIEGASPTISAKYRTTASFARPSVGGAEMATLIRSPCTGPNAVFRAPGWTSTSRSQSPPTGLRNGRLIVKPITLVRIAIKPVIRWRGEAGSQGEAAHSRRSRRGLCLVPACAGRPRPVNKQEFRTSSESNFPRERTSVVGRLSMCSRSPNLSFSICPSANAPNWQNKCLHSPVWGVSFRTGWAHLVKQVAPVRTGFQPSGNFKHFGDPAGEN